MRISKPTLSGKQNFILTYQKINIFKGLKPAKIRDIFQRICNAQLIIHKSITCFSLYTVCRLFLGNYMFQPHSVTFSRTNSFWIHFPWKRRIFFANSRLVARPSYGKRKQFFFVLNRQCSSIKQRWHDRELLLKLDRHLCYIE